MPSNLSPVSKVFRRRCGWLCVRRDFSGLPKKVRLICDKVRVCGIGQPERLKRPLRPDRPIAKSVYLSGSSQDRTLLSISGEFYYGLTLCSLPSSILGLLLVSTHPQAHTRTLTHSHRVIRSTLCLAAFHFLFIYLLRFFLLPADGRINN